MRKFDELCALQCFGARLLIQLIVLYTVSCYSEKRDKFSVFECQELPTWYFKFVDAMSEN